MYRITAESRDWRLSKSPDSSNLSLHLQPIWSDGSVSDGACRDQLGTVPLQAICGVLFDARSHSSTLHVAQIGDRSSHPAYHGLLVFFCAEPFEETTEEMLTGCVAVDQNFSVAAADQI